MEKILFLINPVSGKQDGRGMEKRVRDGLRGLVPESRFDTVFTEENVFAQAQRLAPGYTTIVAAGGDGTISQVVRAVAGMKARPRVGLIPLGTGNDLARSVGVLQAYQQGGLPRLLELFAAGRSRSVDVLELGGEALFKSYFGIGVDAKIADSFHRLRSRPFFKAFRSGALGKLLYAALGLKNLFYRMPFPVRLRYLSEAGRPVEANLPGGLLEVLVTSSRTYAGGAVPSRASKIDDGKFEVTVIATVWQWLLLMLTRFTGRGFDENSAGRPPIQTQWLEIFFSGPVFAQVDGEIFESGRLGKEPLTIGVKTRVEVIAP